jgi:DDE_Tnp_1-associated
MPALALSRVVARVVESGPGGQDLAAGTWRRLEALPDPRSPQGRIYPLACLIAVAVCVFTAAGNDRFTAVGQWIRRASQQDLARLRAPWDPGEEQPAAAARPDHGPALAAGTSRQRHPRDRARPRRDPDPEGCPRHPPGLSPRPPGHQGLPLAQGHRHRQDHRQTAYAITSLTSETGRDGGDDVRHRRRPSEGFAWSARRGGTPETWETCVVVLITQRSEVQILPPLPRPEALSRTEKEPSA